MIRMLGCAGLVLIAATAAADARVTRIEIVKREPFAAGQGFGSVGAYEKVVGRFHGELDPKNPLDAVIVDLDKAPRNAAGMVEYSADFYILKPVDLAKGNGALFYELSNRGNKGILARFNDAPGSNDPTTAQQAGNGFLMQQGFTLLWNGWMTGLPAANDALRIELPVATNPSGPIVETVWDELLVQRQPTPSRRASPSRPPRPTSRRPRSTCATTTARSRPSSRPPIGNSSTRRPCGCCPPARRSGSAPSISWSIRRPIRRSPASALPPPAISSRSRAMRPPTTPARPIRWRRPAGPRSTARCRKATRRADAICAISSTAASTRTRPTASCSKARSRPWRRDACS